jgi:hypothetical protein
MKRHRRNPDILTNIEEDSHTIPVERDRLLPMPRQEPQSHALKR